MARDMVQVRRTASSPFDKPDVKMQRSQFNRSHGHKTTFNATKLVPILVDEVLPGDTFTCSLNGYARIFSPLDAPIMDNIELETCFFFVPNRLIWTNWEAMNGAHDAAGAQDTDFTVPVMADAHVVSEANDVLAYMGVPVNTDCQQVDVNALPLRAYRLIYNEWFRDQNLIDPVSINLDDTDEPTAHTGLLNSAKKHDYFTSCLPYLQKGDPVTVGIGTRATVMYDAAVGTSPVVYANNPDGYRNFNSSGSDLLLDSTTAGSGVPNSQELYADLSGATGVSINALRESVAIQRLLERDARGGTRYVEIIKSHFGVTSPDFRHQRPEYLGGGKSFINVSPVANTSSTATEDQGELKGIGTGVIRGHGWAKSFTEHGYIIGLVRARGDLSYFQGLDKMWSRSTRYDFYIPALANLGEQAVLNKEIFVQNSPASDESVFGYQERWAEYRQKKSLITGKFNPDVTGALSFWHLAEDFSGAPSLNQTFIEDNTPISRVVTVTGEPDFILDVWFDYKCARPIPVFSIPSLTSARF